MPCAADCTASLTAGSCSDGYRIEWQDPSAGGSYKCYPPASSCSHDGSASEHQVGICQMEAFFDESCTEAAGDVHDIHRICTTDRCLDYGDNVYVAPEFRIPNSPLSTVSEWKSTTPDPYCFRTPQGDVCARPLP